MIFESLLELRDAFSNRHPSEAGAWWGEEDSATGLSITPFSVLANTPFYQGVEFISSVIACLPHNTYRRDGGSGVNKDRDSGLSYLLRWEPNRESTAFVFKKAQIVNKLLWGNSYAEIERDRAGKPVAIWHLPSYLVTPKRVYKKAGGGLTQNVEAATPEDRSRGGEILYEVRGCLSGSPEYLNSNEMFHVPGIGFNGLVGFPVLSFAKEALGIGLAMQKSGAAIFGNAATPSAVLERPAEAPGMSPTAERNLIAAWEARHAGTKRAGRVAVLQEGTTYKPVEMISPKELQYAESLRNQVPESARVLNISPYFLGHDGSQNTYSNVEGEWIRLQRQTLFPHTTAIEQEDMRKLVAPEEAGDVYTKHDYKDLLRADSTVRGQMYRVLREVGAIAPAEIARLEELPPVPDDQGGQDFRPMPKAAPPAAVEAAPAPAVKPTPPPPVEPDDDDEEDVPARMARLRAGLQGMLTAGLQRAVTRETKTLRQLIKSSSDFKLMRAAVGDFYANELPAFLTEVASPALGRGAAGFARAYSTRHRRELEASWRPDDVAALLDRWTVSAAAEAAAAELDRLTDL